MPGCSLALPGMRIYSSKAPPRVPLNPTPRLSLCHPTLPSLWNLYLCMPGCSLALPGMGIYSSKAPPRVPLNSTPRLSLCHHSSVKFDQGLPRWLNGRESTCQCRGRGFDPWVGKISWRMEWLPTPVFLHGESTPWTEEPGGLQSLGSQRVRYN